MVNSSEIGENFSLFFVSSDTSALQIDLYSIAGRKCQQPLTNSMDDEKREISSLIDYCSAQGKFPMRVDDSSVGGAADLFHTTCWAVVMVSADSPSQSLSLAFCDVSVTAEGGLRP